MAGSRRRWLCEIFIVFMESLLELTDEPPVKKQQQVKRLINVESELTGSTSGERMRASMEALGIGKSYYYELRAIAAERGLLSAQSTGIRPVAD